MVAFDPYAALGLDRDASDADVKARYRELIREWHPDISDHPDAHERTVQIAQAWTILGDSKLRAEYDRGPRSFMDEWRDWIRERMRVWQVTECLRCGKSLYGQRGIWTAPDGTEYPARIPHRRDMLYCSNACRQAAYRARKKLQSRDPQIESRNAAPVDLGNLEP